MNILLSVSSFFYLALTMKGAGYRLLAINKRQAKTGPGYAR